MQSMPELVSKSFFFSQIEELFTRRKGVVVSSGLNKNEGIGLWKTTAHMKVISVHAFTPIVTHCLCSSLANQSDTVQVENDHAQWFCDTQSNGLSHSLKGTHELLSLFVVCLCFSNFSRAAELIMVIADLLLIQWVHFYYTLSIICNCMVVFV